MSGWTPAVKNTAVGPIAYAVTENGRQAIESVLQQTFERESPKILEELTRGVRRDGIDDLRQKYRRVSAGGARINFDVQAFRLTPDGLPRLFVRAVWNLDGKTVFLMSAWLRTAPALEIEAADLHAAKQAVWLDFKYDGPMEPSYLGEVLNITDVDRDRFAEIVMLYHYYEGISIEISKYPPTGPGGAQVIAKFGAGC